METIIKDMLNKGLVSFEMGGFVLQGKAQNVFDLVRLAQFSTNLWGGYVTRSTMLAMLSRNINNKN